MQDASAAQQIDDIISLYGGWKGDMLAQLRAVIMAADPDAQEAVKWRMASRPEGLPVWYHNGIMCLAETFRDNIKLVFVKGSDLPDPHHLFNARLNSKTNRAIMLQQGDTVPQQALAQLVQAAVQYNTAQVSKR